MLCLFFLTILAFYLYKTKKSYLGLGITLGLSVCTRSLGSMLFFAIFICMFVNFLKRKDKKYWGLFLYLIITLISISSTIRGDSAAIVSMYRYIFGCFPVYFMIKEKNVNTIILIAITGFVSFMFLLGIHFY